MRRAMRIPSLGLAVILGLASAPTAPAYAQHRASDDQQIVCTGSGLLPSMVHGGEFDHRLYYRLNTVCIKLTDS